MFFFAKVTQVQSCYISEYQILLTFLEDLRLSESKKSSSYLIIGHQGPKLHTELESKEVVGPNWLHSQQSTQGSQLRTIQAV